MNNNCIVSMTQLISLALATLLGGLLILAVLVLYFDSLETLADKCRGAVNFQSSRLMAARALNFKLQSADGAARTGLLTHGRGVLETPALLLYTRRGSPLYLTPDMLKHLGPDGHNFILDATQFLGNPAPETLAKAAGGGRGFCALTQKFLAVTDRDSVVYNYRHWRKGTNEGVRVEAFSGGQQLTPQAYLKVASLFQPDLLVPLCDEVPAEADEESLKHSLRRSLEWLDSSLASLEPGTRPSSAILAPVQGGSSPELRRRSASEVRKRAGVFGYALCGMGTGETARQRRECAQAALEELPADSFKLLQGALTPDGVLDAIALGVDCFDATYATQVTAAGYALCLEGGRDESEAARGGHDDVKINLLDAKFKEDLRPLVEGCSCFTCCNHSRAYLYHLLIVHEMTAQVLLELHNMHQFLAFFRQLRAAISQQSFGQFHEAFLRRRAACRALKM